MKGFLQDEHSHGTSSYYEDHIRAGKMAGGKSYANVARISLHKHFPGGPGFGAKNWPAVELEVEFCEGEDQECRKLAERLAEVTHDFLVELEQTRVAKVK